MSERLRARGWRLTPQRRVVAEVRHGDHVHLSAEAVHGLPHAGEDELGLDVKLLFRGVCPACQVLAPAP